MLSSSSTLISKLNTCLHQLRISIATKESNPSRARGIEVLSSSSDLSKNSFSFFPISRANVVAAFSSLSTAAFVLAFARKTLKLSLLPPDEAVTPSVRLR
ncbi:hypothetical protein I7I50_00980 [Histoplasma capsulatum G186AR]|uniref:Uncharacterized protein n=1 Tax=Ajellomyces capsulatus TaxID=5037 RepID=A0A8H7YK54_AJECA|nr:hypothetical protein I7I52_08246 [Histoplasma capsulatum]QSS72972.1 hypothetical protein I7I50_00980 [Histoplasma capsulatum G186AR]